MEKLIFPVTEAEARKAAQNGTKAIYSSEQNRKALFPEQLRLLRKEAGESQAVTARALGVSKSTLGLWETGDTLPSAKDLYGLARHYSVSADYLLGLSEYKTHEAEALTAQDAGLSEKAALVLRAMQKVNPDMVQAVNALLEGEAANFLPCKPDHLEAEAERACQEGGEFGKPGALGHLAAYLFDTTPAGHETEIETGKRVNTRKLVGSMYLDELRRKLELMREAHFHEVKAWDEIHEGLEYFREVENDEEAGQR